MDKKIHQIKCEGCGSNIDPNKMFCEHCGAKIFIASSLGVKQKAVITDEMLNAMLKANSRKAPTFIIVIFMIIWCSIAFFGAISLFSFGSPMGIMPAIMGVIGIFLMISQIKLAKKANFKEIHSLYDAKNYKKAGELLEAKLKSTKNYVARQLILMQLIILNYYSFNNIKKAKEYLLEIQTTNYDLPLTINQIANELSR